MASIMRMFSLFRAVYEILWIENVAVLPIENTPVYSKGSFCRDNEALLSPQLLKMSITKTRQNTGSGDQ